MLSGSTVLAQLPSFGPPTCFSDLSRYSHSAINLSLFFKSVLFLLTSAHYASVVRDDELKGRLETHSDCIIPAMTACLCYAELVLTQRPTSLTHNVLCATFSMAMGPGPELIGRAGSDTINTAEVSDGSEIPTNVCRGLHED